MLRSNILAISFLSLMLSACGPSMRIKPGELPPAKPPATNLRVEAEQYIAAHVDQNNYEKLRSGAEYNRIKALVGRLAKAAGYGADTFPVHLVDAGDEVNASAWNGASIVVYRELLRRVPKDEELAAVLGHEIGHIMMEHYKDAEEEKKRATAVGVGSSILGAVVGVAAAAAGAGGGVADVAGDLTETTTGAIGYGAFVGSFSRTQEYEADHIGLLIMARAGYDPEAALRFWRRADEVFGSSTSSVGAFFSTHPASADREKALLEAMPHAIKEYKGGSAGAAK